MKKSLYALLIGWSVFSCQKTASENGKIDADSTKIIDSINAARTKINDSIRSKNNYGDLSGTHILTHNSITGKGKVDFKKIGRDNYLLKGDLQSGKNYTKIDGSLVRVSPKHFNFTGEITQSIQEYDHGKKDIRKGNYTFLSKDGGKTWRLQDMVNDAGFVDYIDIKF